MAAAPADPQPCSVRSHTATLLGAAAVNVAACVWLLLERRPPPNDHRAVPAFILGISSVWIPVPAIMAAVTPASHLIDLSPKQLMIRRAAMLLSLPACLASLAAWYCWTPFLGMCDEALAASLLWLFLLNGVMRGGWAACSTASSFYATFALAIMEPSLWRYQPWPHLAIRAAAMMSGISGLNAGFLITTPRHLIYIMLAAVTVCVVHVWVEQWLAAGCADKTCDSLLTGGSYLGGSVRCYFAMLFFLHLLYHLWYLLLTQASTQAPEDPESGDSSSIESEMESKVVSGRDSEVDSSISLVSQLSK